MFRSQCSNRGLAKTLCKGRVVNSRRRYLSLTYCDNGHAIRRHAVSNGHALYCGLANSGDDLVAHGFAVGAQGEPHGYFLGNDVALEAAMDGAHCKHGGLLRIDLPADDTLRQDHKFGRHQDGIFASARMRTMGSNAAHDHVDACGAGQQRPSLDTHIARSQRAVIVLGKNQIRLSESLIEMIRKRGAGAVDRLFRWLTD